MSALDKHKSKLHKGFIKQRQRQDKKDNEVSIKLIPIVLTYSHKKGKYVPVKIKHRNNKWNGMNLKVLCNSFSILRVGGMYGKFTINKEGKYKLSIYGKQLHKKLQLKRQINKP